MTLRAYRRDLKSHSPLQIYLHDINDTPLLVGRGGARAGRAGRARATRHAREHMVKANLRLVVNIARGYLGKGLCLEDLIEEGNLGLMRAVEGFDGMMDTRFSTYASYWIKQSIRRAVMNNGKPIRLPAYMVSLLAKWKRVTTGLTERLGRAPTPEEVGQALRLSKKKVGIVAKAIKVNNLTPHAEGADDDGIALDDVLTDERSKAPDDLLIEADDLERIFEHLEQLDEREATVDPDAVRPRPLLADDPPRGRREPRPDPRARPPAREPGAPQAHDGAGRRPHARALGQPLRPKGGLDSIYEQIITQAKSRLRKEPALRLGVCRWSVPRGASCRDSTTPWGAKIVLDAIPGTPADWFISQGGPFYCKGPLDCFVRWFHGSWRCWA